IRENSPLWEVFAATGLDERLYTLGRQASSVIVDLFGEVSDNMKILERLDLIDTEKLPEYGETLRRTEGVPMAEVATADRQRLMRAALNYIEPRHRLDLLDDEFREAVVASRKTFRESVPPHLVAEF